MANETQITVIGNLTADPEVRFVGNGSAVANFTIASTPRAFDKNSNEWKDGETLFLRASVWREQAENVAESLQKGMKVIAQGNLKSRSFETKEGEKRTVTEFDVTTIGPSLERATAKVTKSGGGNGGGQGRAQQNAPQGPPQGQWGQQPQNNQWGAQNGAQGWGQGNQASAPF